jgi:phage gp36-like protein
MDYAVQQDMIDRFGEAELIQLTDRSNPPAEVIDATVLAGALSDANQEVEASVGARYPLPLPSIPPVLTRCACDLARYFLYDVKAPEEVRNRATDARALLKSIAAGTVSLGLPTAPDSLGEPEADGPDRVFTADTLRDYWP